MQIVVRSIMNDATEPRWHRFLELLQRCILELGHEPTVVPCRDMYPSDPYPERLSIFPHCRKQETPTGRLFYKEMYLKGLFTLDRLGWGPDHSTSRRPFPLDASDGRQAAYQLTDIGEKLRPISHALICWGRNFPDHIASDAESRPEWDMLAIESMFREPSEAIAIFRIPGAWEDEGFKILKKYGVDYCDRSVSMYDAAGRAVAKLQEAS